MGGGRGKGLKPEDAALWAKVARTMEARMPGRPSPEEFHAMVEKALGGAEAAKGAAMRPGRLKSSTRSAPPKAPPGAAPSGPALHGHLAPGQLDRRSRQRLARGNVMLEARLDLHGMGAEMARSRLRSFLSECRMRGLRTVLVITGKGASPYARHTLHGHEHWHAPERAGRLRRLVPQWLHEHDFAHHVAGFQPAHPKHGGGGAFYIRLRRKDRGRAP